MTIKSKMTERALKYIDTLSGVKFSFGKLIWAIRMCEEETQVAFAKKLHITRQHLCDIEHDRKPVRPKLAAKYAEILGYSKEQFVRLALQDLLDRDGVKLEIEIISGNTRKRKRSQEAA